MPVEEVRVLAEGMMAEVAEDLAALVRIPSCAFPGFPPEPVLETAQAVVDLLGRYGVPGARLLDVPGGYPAVYAEIPGRRERRPSCSMPTTTSSPPRWRRGGTWSRSSRRSAMAACSGAAPRTISPG